MPTHKQAVAMMLATWQDYLQARKRAEELYFTWQRSLEVAEQARLEESCADLFKVHDAVLLEDLMP